MKTIAITMDEETLRRVDHLLRNGLSRWRSRSEAVREAVRDFVTRLERAAAEERERAVVDRHAALLHRQAKALLREQAKP